MEFHHDDPSEGELPDEYRPHFEGVARLQRYPNPFEAGPTVFSVHFEAGGRTRPHLHHSGQLLYITAGEGIVATRAARRTVRPGDVVTVAPDEWHWHGGGPATAMTHLTVQMAAPDDVNWQVDEGDWAEGYRAPG